MKALKTALSKSRALRERFSEDLGARIEANYDLLADDADGFIESFFNLSETEAGAEFLCQILGVAELSQIQEDFEQEIAIEFEEGG